ncbi:single-stranded-DNA-specific exonuclease RecJ [Candidatus Wirthbacteria bacterium CG2_30_54_11]|uniref:Single-stranded-DNA-specific exonuclease RecJ n=1 Tax=Candidatus Wirthbacteria bacterium CG2_30_54_11 TaxID=1817892 RepID=A0A1J5IDQ5_9BACT|nr:MAG: single-stranded-DNA-specific exonuclease RecJ [Candidatus Wirthbacteria bacterium CG2_30_54_11]
MQQKRWVVADKAPDEVLQELSSYGSLAAQLMFNRGITTKADAEAYLNPSLSQLHDPYLLCDMDKAVERILKAREAKEKVAVFGDYDVDGVASTVLLTQVFRQIGLETRPYIPERMSEGYGLNLDAMELLAREGITLIVTVDCGISGGAEIIRAAELGIDVIVTDHHHVTGELPAAYAVIDPKREDCGYPYPDLAGVGLAYKLAEAVRRTVSFGYEHDPFDLVALATIADIAPLTGENRTLVALGLAAINRTKRPGLLALIDCADIKRGTVDSYHVGFYLGPRLNAAGRLTHAKQALELLMADEDSLALKLARELTLLNKDRQDLTVSIVEQAKAEIEKQLGNKVFVISGESWPSGIVGLVAGRICESYYRPVFVLEKGEMTSRGSARSIAGFHVAEALTECRDLLNRFGGHALAGGFEIDNVKLPEFIDRLEAIAERTLDAESLTAQLRIDAEAPLNSVTYDLWRTTERMRPFGYHNPSPVFMASRVGMRYLKKIGAQQNHLKLVVEQGSCKLQAVGFNLGELFGVLSQEPYADIVFSVDENEWEGVKSLQLKLKDIRPAGSSFANDIPSR